MVATKAARSRQRSKSGNKRVRGTAHAGGVGVRRGSANEGDVATKEAWSAVVKAVRSGKAQPARTARATRKALSNVARAGARQTGVAADAIARATEAVLITAMNETRTAAKAAREAAKEVERSVGKALKAIERALRQRAYAEIDKAAQEGHSTVKRIARRQGRPRVPPR